MVPGWVGQGLDAATMANAAGDNPILSEKKKQVWNLLDLSSPACSDLEPTKVATYTANNKNENEKMIIHSAGEIPPSNTIVASTEFGKFSCEMNRHEDCPHVFLNVGVFFSLGE